MKSSLFLAVSIAAALLVPCSMTAQMGEPRVFELNPAAVAKAKAHPSPELLAQAKKEADTAMKVTVVPITAKPQTPPSGDKRDYLSMGTYWWPNPDTPNHLPYVRHDGQHNPEAKNIPDHENFDRMVKAVHALALEYYLTGDTHYAVRAVEHLRAWYVTPATAMHPNMKYAQYIAGVNEGRGAGILDTRMLPQVIDAEGLLAASQDWTAADRAAFHQGADRDHGVHEAGCWRQGLRPGIIEVGKTRPKILPHGRSRQRRIDDAHHGESPLL